MAHNNKADKKIPRHSYGMYRNLALGIPTKK